MTLRKLHARLGEIIAENEARGWGERNDLPALTEMVRDLKRHKSVYLPIDYVSGSQLTVGGKAFCGVMMAREKEKITP